MRRRRERMAKGRKLAKLSAEACIYYGASQQLNKWPAASCPLYRRFLVESPKGGTAGSEMSKLMKPLFRGGLGPVQVLKS